MQLPRRQQLGKVRTIWHVPYSTPISWTRALCAATVGESSPISRVNYAETVGCSVQIVAQHLGSGRVPQLAHCLGLNLADPLPRDPIHFADLIQGLGLPVGQSEAHRHHSGFALTEGVQYVVQLLLQKGEA